MNLEELAQLDAEKSDLDDKEIEHIDVVKSVTLDKTWHDIIETAFKDDKNKVT